MSAVATIVAVFSFRTSCLYLLPPPRPSTLFPYTTLFRSLQAARANFDAAGLADAVVLTQADVLDMKPPAQDRKSTRLNSSHITISYAVFCLKKKRGLRNGVEVNIDSTLQSIKRDVYQDGK